MNALAQSININVETLRALGKQNEEVVPELSNMLAGVSRRI